MLTSSAASFHNGLKPPLNFPCKCELSIARCMRNCYIYYPRQLDYLTLFPMGINWWTDKSLLGNFKIEIPTTAISPTSLLPITQMSVSVPSALYLSANLDNILDFFLSLIPSKQSLAWPVCSVVSMGPSPSHWHWPAGGPCHCRPEFCDIFIPKIRLPGIMKL